MGSFLFRNCKTGGLFSDYIWRPNVLFTITGDKSIKNKVVKSRKSCTTTVDERRIKRLSPDRRISSMTIRSDLNDASVSVSSRIIRRRLTDVREEVEFPTKKALSHFTAL
ncbi:hypothetical protein TNCV_3424301 [Trichonephila clavipes]|nr:hypothetical protein TNCV_3424301 [Trichonephila clavipes]